MPRRNANVNQIIRKDGNNCFVEVLSNSFDIGRVLMKFVTYDPTKATGSKFTNEIDIYLSFEQFLRIKYDILGSQSLIKRINAYKQEADAQTKATGKKTYSKQHILSQGGTSARSLESRGKARPDGMSLSRTLKVFAGDKMPFIFLAEQGPGEEDSKGLIVPKYGFNPEQRVMIGLSADDVKEIFLLTEAKLNAYLVGKQVMLFMYPEMAKQQNTQQTQPRPYEPQQYRPNNAVAPATQPRPQTPPAQPSLPNISQMQPQVPQQPQVPVQHAVMPQAPNDYFSIDENDLFGSGEDNFM